MYKPLTEAELREEMFKRDMDWHIAYTRLCIEFEADHGGGFPLCLLSDGMDSEARLQLLKSLGYRVRND